MKNRLDIKVVPGSSRNEVVGWLGECLKVKVVAPPEKGMANHATIMLLSKTLEINEDAVTIVSGSGSQRKVVEINGISHQQLIASLPPRPA